jgi:cysteine sulfinate desulfinase/cysteine desulfurase-like protein
MAEPLADGAIRLCVGKFNTDEEIERAAAMIVSAMQEPTKVQARNAI